MKWVINVFDINKISEILKSLIETNNEDCIVVPGIIPNVPIYLNYKRVMENRKYIAKILSGISKEHFPYVYLTDLVKMTNGNVWNKLETIDEFSTLDLLLAASVACGFIDNSEKTQKENLLRLDGLGKFFISPNGSAMFVEETKERVWLKLIRENIIPKFKYFISIKKVEEACTENQDTSGSDSKKAYQKY